MRKKSNRRKKNNLPSKAKKSKIEDSKETEDVLERQMELKLLKLSLEGPSTSQSITQKSVLPLEANKLMGLKQKVNVVIDDCFRDQSELVVNCRMFEDIVSETLLQFYSQEENCTNMSEAKHLTEQCKALQCEQIKLNRQRYALKKQVEDAKHIIKKMIDEKQLFSRGIVRRIPPGGMKRQVRSVGLQVCLVGPMFVTNPVINYSTSITSRYREVIMPPKEQPRTARKRTVNVEVGTRKDNEPYSYLPSSTNFRTPIKKENTSESKLNVSSKRKSEESVNSTVLCANEYSSRRKSNTTNRSISEEIQSENSRAVPKRNSATGNKSDIVSKRMSTRKTKVEETEYKNSRSSVKEKSIKELNNDSNVKQAANLTLASQHPSIAIKQECNIPIKEEIIDIDEGVYDIVVISEDEDEDVKPEVKEVTKIIDKKEVGTQVNVNINVSENSCPNPSSSLGPGAEPLIKVRSPEFINEHLIKSLNPSHSKDSDNISYCQLPKYPMSPRYPPDVSKPPAPILQVGKKTDVETQGVMLTWSFARKKPENIVEYQLFAYQERSGRNAPTSDLWKKVGDIKALPLPMACYLSQFVEDETYHFIIRAVDSQRRLGDFSIPAGIKLQKLDPSDKTPTGTLIQVPSTSK